MKYEHTLVLTAEMSKIIVTDHSGDLSEKLAFDAKRLLSTVFDNVNVVRCQDFILETNEEEDPGDWIRFDPEDRLTWPLEEINGFSIPVIMCTSQDEIYMGYICNMFNVDEKESYWDASNYAEDLTLPLDSVIAWQPLPKPFHMEQEAEG